MNITILGTGNMGTAFAQQISAAGHQLNILGRDSAKVRASAERFGASAETALAASSDVVIVATGYPDAVAALRGASLPEGAVVVDITNPLTPDYMGLTLGHSSSAAEQIAAAMPQLRVVKAFNTVFAQRLAAGARLPDGQVVPVFVATDDAQARQRVADLAGSMGFDVIDAGPLRNARYLEPLAGLNIYLGYAAGLGTLIAPTWLRQA
ncbi:MAG: NAD(P)-binding domain-containing protein [Betaproteobacteria bacterium]|nr:NAD(P)-binding domain-containing protein [Betaproteobacteria bacterium]MBU6513943.1 NAD(P)-binding domain-containing protein [Betaproteobacteria bacterium]MDE1956664.1 NAD(P)-binding domain-containing protein [Betaproteobacteria bacterium]MDE2153934.1 NAD(P)-binding domain-containing protein [Betaproteobacteria bacterium]MDE2479244.1 NAD(P)-binding domain-containing protein [Betaproteobacteria bacterium]